MDYFFDKSLRSFTNVDKTLKVFLTSTHMVIVDDVKRRSIRMPNRVHKYKDQKPERWVYELNRVNGDINLRLKFKNVVYTEILLTNTLLRVTYHDKDGVNSKGSFYWNHNKGCDFLTETIYF